MASWVVLTGLVVMGVGVGLLPMALTGLEPDATKQSHRRVRVGCLGTAWCQQ
jgi:hypothetical protein